MVPEAGVKFRSASAKLSGDADKATSQRTPLSPNLIQDHRCFHPSEKLFSPSQATVMDQEPAMLPPKWDSVKHLVRRYYLDDGHLLYDVVGVKEHVEIIRPQLKKYRATGFYHTVSPADPSNPALQNMVVKRSPFACRNGLMPPYMMPQYNEYLHHTILLPHSNGLALQDKVVEHDMFANNITAMSHSNPDFPHSNVHSGNQMTTSRPVNHLISGGLDLFDSARGISLFGIDSKSNCDQCNSTDNRFCPSRLLYVRRRSKNPINLGLTHEPKATDQVSSAPGMFCRPVESAMSIDTAIREQMRIEHILNNS
jgi:hypothetical protein